MECLRQTIDSDRLSGVLDLPPSFQNSVVEIIVLPSRDNLAVSAPVKSGGSAYGCLKNYANPAMIAQEKGAWERAVAERYANR